MPNGTVKFFNVAKGFGFITPDEGGKEIFLPAAALAPAGLSILKMGQRVSFEAIPDSKGPKAANINLLAEVVSPAVSPKTGGKVSPPAEGGRTPLTFYHDPSSEESRAALEELHGAGHQPRIVEYLTTPPDREELRRLSLLLRAGGQSLVKRYDPLFLALSLDDRFISESEFWQAIAEHPALINGPIVASAAKAALCGSANAVKAFLAPSSSAAPPAARRKSLPASILAMIGGSARPQEETTENKEAPRPAAKAVPAAPKAKPAPQPEPKPKPAPKAKKKTVVAAKPRAKSPPPKVKTKPSAKAKPASKPAKRRR